MTLSAKYQSSLSYGVRSHVLTLGQVVGTMAGGVCCPSVPNFQICRRPLNWEAWLFKQTFVVSRGWGLMTFVPLRGSQLLARSVSTTIGRMPRCLAQAFPWGAIIMRPFLKCVQYFAIRQNISKTIFPVPSSLAVCFIVHRLGAANMAVDSQRCHL